MEGQRKGLANSRSYYKYLNLPNEVPEQKSIDTTDNAVLLLSFQHYGARFHSSEGRILDPCQFGANESLYPYNFQCLTYGNTHKKMKKWRKYTNMK